MLDDRTLSVAGTNQSVHAPEAGALAPSDVETLPGETPAGPLLAPIPSSWRCLEAPARRATAPAAVDIRVTLVLEVLPGEMPEATWARTCDAADMPCDAPVATSSGQAPPEVGRLVKLDIPQGFDCYLEISSLPQCPACSFSLEH